MVRFGNDTPKQFTSPLGYKVRTEMAGKTKVRVLKKEDFFGWFSSSGVFFIVA